MVSTRPPLPLRGFGSCSLGSPFGSQVLRGAPKQTPLPACLVLIHPFPQCPCPPRLRVGCCSVPAVSRISSTDGAPSTAISLLLKSSMVGSYFSMNVPDINLTVRALFSIPPDTNFTLPHLLYLMARSKQQFMIGTTYPHTYHLFILTFNYARYSTEIKWRSFSAFIQNNSTFHKLYQANICFSPLK